MAFASPRKRLQISAITPMETSDRRSPHAPLVLLVWLSACTSAPATPDASTAVDAAPDAVDAAPDVVGADAPADRAPPLDVPPDVAPDLAPDVALDTPARDDPPPRDGDAVDAPADAPVDAPVDAPATPDVMSACDGGTCAATQRSCQPGSDGGTPPGCGLVRVEGGSFTMGVPADCRTAGAARDTCVYDASPVQTNVTVGGFFIDAHEVTVARFRAFWRARMADGGASLRARPVRYPDLDGSTRQEVTWGTDLGAEPSPTGTPPVCNWTAEPGSREAHPINCVTWWTAMEFCVWDRGEGSYGTPSNGRLPSEAEWEYAARGRELTTEGLAPGRTYPWGMDAPGGDDMLTCTRAQWNRCPGDDGGITRQVGHFAASGGLFDLAGNVSEWVADRLGPYASTSSTDPCVNRSERRDPVCLSATSGNRVIRGGDALSFQNAFVRAAARAGNGPGFTTSIIGFRCVSSRM